MERNKPRCYFDEYDDICAALSVKACEGCKFYQSTADYIDGQMKAEKILEEKGLKPMMVNRRKIYSKREIVAFLEQNNERR